NMKNNYIFIIVCLAIFIGLKLVYPYLDTDFMRFLLTPTNKIVEIISGSKAIYNPTNGYFYPELNIVINKSCSGYNFWLISFLITTFVLFKSEIIKKRQIIPLALLLSYITTPLVNTSRIIGYMIMIDSKTTSITTLETERIHQMEGILVYLTFLILIYISLNYIVNKIRHNYEKTTQSEVDIID
ncbi:exosortase K, partial [Dysgonomonas sp. Marseille-P4677]|uniref:exosortase K n=1 Tax=Dysgonomonas sp. Marseille-P4677 TaxID=2364790 RepID=UPI0019139E0C